MNKWKKIRERININDGKYSQFENDNLTIFNAIGYLLLVAALIVYLLHDKAGFNEAWPGLLFLPIVFSLIIIGITKIFKNYTAPFVYVNDYSTLESAVLAIGNDQVDLYIDELGRNNMDTHVKKNT